MGFFKRDKIVLHSKMKGEPEQIIKRYSGMTTNEFIDWAKVQIAQVSRWRVEWYYVINETTGEFLYDISK